MMRVSGFCLAILLWSTTAVSAGNSVSSPIDAVTRERLVTQTSPSGVTIQRWHDPELNPQDYFYVIIDPVRYFPANPQPNGHVSRQLLAKLPKAITQLLKSEIGKRMPLADRPAPRTLRFSAAITAVAAENQGLQARELIPIALIFSAFKLAAGTRAKEAVIAFEWTLRDARTGKLLAAGSRKGIGEILPEGDAPITLEHLRPAIDTWATDAKEGFTQFILPH